MHMFLLLACIETGVQDRVADPDPGNIAPQEPAVDEECPETQAVDPSVTPTECQRPPRLHTPPTLSWEVPTFVHKPAAKMVMMAPVAAESRVWFISFEGRSWYKGGVLRALDGATGEVLVSVANTDLEGSSGLALGDLDGDGSLEVVGVSTTGQAIAFDWSGTELWRSQAFASDVGYSANPTLADLDGDGTLEVLVGRAVVSHTGETLGIGTLGKGTPGSYGATPVAADLDGDGILEVLVGNGAFDAQGQTLWSLEEPDGFVGVGDVDGDGADEVVVSGGGKLRVQSAEGVRWSVALPGAESTQGGPPTLADLDGDGAHEIAVSAGAALSVFNGSGELLWEAATEDSSTGITALCAFDLSGDGHPELVLADEVAVRAFGPTGQALWTYENHGNWTTVEYATFADIDGDGHAELMVARSENPNDPERSYTGLAVLGSDNWPQGPLAWPQHALSSGDGSFRAWPGLSSPGVDLQLGFEAVCELECTERVIGEVILVNYGTMSAQAGSVTLWDGDRILQQWTHPGLDPGAGVAFAFEVDVGVQPTVTRSADALDCAEPEGVVSPAWCL